MSRQETIERITGYLPSVTDEVLKSLLTLLEHVEPLDAWEKQISADSLSGKFDTLIKDVLSEHKASQTTDLIKELKARK